jgi:hypothetical protein
MIKLKQVIHYTDTNSVEATWVDLSVIPAVGTEGEEGYQPERVEETVVRCHSYDDRQMDMLRSDLGADAADYEELMALVIANQRPLAEIQTPEPEPVDPVAKLQAFLRNNPDVAALMQ